MWIVLSGVCLFLLGVFTGSASPELGSSGRGFAAGYGWDAALAITSAARGAVQNWGRTFAGQPTSAGSNVTRAPDFDYTGFDPKGRRETVATNLGTWTYAYRGGDTGDGQLASATSTGNDLGTFVYTFDGIGRRTDFDSDPQIANEDDPLNQLGGMTHPQVAKNLYISADPDARVWFNGNEIDPAPADFDGFKAVPLGHPGSSGGWVQWTVKGVLAGAGDPGANPDAEAEFGGYAWFPPQSESFTYDADGNRESSELWDYGWDGRNRLVRARTQDWATAGEGWDLRFNYDAEGRRFKKEVTRYADGQAVEHKVIYYVWDGWDLVYERHQDGNGNALLERKYIWGLDISSSRGGAGGAGGLLLMRETRGQTTEDYYPLYDGTGHVVGLSDDNGNLVAEYWWGPFGELIEAKGAMAQANPWRYGTKYFDSETGLYYFGHRYYDPVTGQWLNREPLGESESLNLYAYCHNDSIGHVDVRGLASVAIDGGIFPLHDNETGLPDLIFPAGLNNVDAGWWSLAGEWSWFEMDLLVADVAAAREQQQIDALLAAESVYLNSFDRSNAFSAMQMGDVDSFLFYQRGNEVQQALSPLGPEWAAITQDVNTRGRVSPFVLIMSDAYARGGEEAARRSMAPLQVLHAFSQTSVDISPLGAVGTLAGAFEAASDSRGFAAAGLGALFLVDVVTPGRLRGGSAPNSGVDKAWKAKIHGTAQQTGTPGHRFRMYREAITEAKKPNVTSVHLDHGYNRALGLDPKTITPNRRPDVISIYDNNMVRRVEVPSATDRPAILRSRNSALDQQLIDNGFTPTPPVIVWPTRSP